MVGCIGKEIDQKSLETSKVYDAIREMKDRDDLHALCDKWSWNRHYEIRSRIIDKLTMKQFQRVTYNQLPFAKVTKSKKIHDMIYELELLAMRIEAFHSAVNFSFGFEGDTNRFAKNA